jgi:nucleoid-associated protein YgaU
LKFKIAGALGLLVVAGGSYFGYQQYFSKSTEPDAKDQQSEEIADSESGENIEKIGATTGRDPFDDDEFLNVARGDDFDESDHPEPRRMAHPSQAAPLARRHAPVAADRPHANQTRSTLNDDILDPDDDSDDSSPPRITQSEPDLDDEDVSAEPPRKTATPGRSPKHGATAHQPARGHNAGPRLDSRDERDLAADIDADLLAETSDAGKLDGYELAAPKSVGKHPSKTRGPKISIIDARDEPDADERLEGFETENATTRRAVSKTKIVRPVADESFDDELSATDIGGNSNRESASRSGATPIRPRGSTPPPPDSRIRANRLSADEFSDMGASGGGADSDTYRVQPEDNFWKISRKHYGSARYYQALVRHNRDRVPDPQKLRPGTQISTPTAAYLERHYANLIEKSASGSAHQNSASRGLASHGTGGSPRFERPASDDGFDSPVESENVKAAADGYFYSKSGEPMYRIGADDTLTGIAQRHLGRASRWTEIYEQNQDILKSPDNLTLGTVIRLPNDASRLSLVPENDRRR